MKGEIAVESGSYGGKLFLAVFVLGLESGEEIAKLTPIVRRAVETSAKAELRHGMHVVTQDDEPPTPAA